MAELPTTPARDQNWIDQPRPRFEHGARWEMKATPDEHAPEIMQWAHRELNDMPMIIDVACKLEKVMEFLK